MDDGKNPGVSQDDRLPTSIPHDPNRQHVRHATIAVDTTAPSTPLQHIWDSLGYDEINWTYMPTGKRLLQKFGQFSPRPFLIRPHYVFCSGTGFGLPHWGNGNVYHEDEHGHPYFDFSIVDQVYDSIVAAGHHVLVELGFTPRDLLPEQARELKIVDSPTTYSAYEAGQYTYPPRDYAKWGMLVSALAAHCLERYGEEEISHWKWELWNEPDIFYWRGTQKEFFDLYAETASAVRKVLPEASVGGPTVTGGPDGVDYLRNFLLYCKDHGCALSFVSFHTKGSQFTPWRTYKPPGAPFEKQSPSTAKMLVEIRRLLRVIEEFPDFIKLPIYITECDAGVPAHWGVYDNPNFAFQNTEYYASFQANLMKKLLDLNESHQTTIQLATTWSFYFEGERFFEGTRAFITAAGIEKPLLNIYRVFARLGDHRLRATSDASWTIASIAESPAWTTQEEVDVLASRGDDGTVALLVYRHTDDQWQIDAEKAVVDVNVEGLVDSEYMVEHFLIDKTHSNAHTIWQALCSPQDPTESQLEAMRRRQGLEAIEEPKRKRSEGEKLRLRIEMALPSVSLVLLRAADG